MPDKIVKRRGGGRYLTPPQIDLGLRALVRNGGSGTTTARELGIPVDTVNSWRRRHRERYEELRVQMGPELEAQAIADFRGFVQRAEEAKSLALEKTVDALEAGDIKDPAKTLQAISISQGIAVQKVLELSGRPTAIVEHRSMAEALARLRALGAEVIEGTAVAVVDSAEPTVSAPVAELPSEAT